MWAKTGIASLRDGGLSEVPDNLWRAAASIRAADLGGNAFSCLPPDLARLTGLTRLRLSHNALISKGIPWLQLAALTQLRVLSLDHNRYGNQLTCIWKQI